MKKSIIFLSIVLFSIPLLFAQNTKVNVNETLFIGKYSFVDAKGNSYDLEIKKSNWNSYNDYSKGYSYSGLGTCSVNGRTHYFKWYKNADNNYLEIHFSKADYPKIEINGESYRSAESFLYTTFSGVAFFIKDSYLYYDNSAMEAENPNLRLKLTKKQ